MIRAAIIENNKVVNVITTETVLPNMIPSECANIEDDWDGHSFTNSLVSVREVPTQVTMWQARDILIKYNLLDDVVNFINEIEDPVERKRSHSRFEFSSTVLRSDPLLNFITSRAGYTKETVDSWFIEADALL